MHSAPGFYYPGSMWDLSKGEEYRTEGSRRLNERRGRQNYPHIPLPFSIISFKPDNSESNLSELVCHAMCV